MFVSLFIFNEDQLNMHFGNLRQVTDLMSSVLLNQKTFLWSGGDNM